MKLFEFSNTFNLMAKLLDSLMVALLTIKQSDNQTINDIRQILNLTLSS